MPLQINRCTLSRTPENKSETITDAPSTVSVSVNDHHSVEYYVVRNWIRNNGKTQKPDYLIIHYTASSFSAIEITQDKWDRMKQVFDSTRCYVEMESLFLGWVAAATGGSKPVVRHSEKVIAREPAVKAEEVDVDDGSIMRVYRRFNEYQSQRDGAHTFFYSAWDVRLPHHTLRCDKDKDIALASAQSRCAELGIPEAVTIDVSEPSVDNDGWCDLYRSDVHKWQQNVQNGVWASYTIPSYTKISKPRG